MTTNYVVNYLVDQGIIFSYGKTYNIKARGATTNKNKKGRVEQIMFFFCTVIYSFININHVSPDFDYNVTNKCIDDEEYQKILRDKYMEKQVTLHEIHNMQDEESTWRIGGAT